MRRYLINYKALSNNHAIHTVAAFLLGEIDVKGIEFWERQVFRCRTRLLGIMTARVHGAIPVLRGSSMNSSCAALPRVRFLLMALTGILFFAVVGAPILSAHGHPLLGACLYLLFSPICHQMPQRSFMLSGLPWAVCQRCAGIYFGLFAGSVLLPARWWASSFSIERRRAWAIVAAAPLLADALLPLVRLWESAPSSRFLTGALFGVMLITLLLPGAAEFLRELRMRPNAYAQPAEPEGGFS